MCGEKSSEDLKKWFLTLDNTQGVFKATKQESSLGNRLAVVTQAPPHLEKN